MSAKAKQVKDYKVLLQEDFMAPKFYDTSVLDSKFRPLSNDIISVSDTQSEFTARIMRLLYRHPMRVIWVSSLYPTDASPLDKERHGDVHRMFWQIAWEDEEYLPGDLRGVEAEYFCDRQYIVNKTKREYIDTADYLYQTAPFMPEHRPLNPLPLLTAIGVNGKDYFGLHADAVGEWAGDEIYTTDLMQDIPIDYKRKEVYFFEHRY